MIVSRRTFQVANVFSQDPYRMSTYQYYLNIFMEHPFWGKGIVPYTNFVHAPNRIFTDMQLIGGGHGAYLSVLAIFGVGGVFFWYHS